MRAMLLAAGLGTRLAPLTDERPKPVVPLGLEPIAAGALRAFARAGVDRIDVNAFHLPRVLDARLRPFAPEGIRFEVHTETELLGTGGGIRGATAGGDADEILVMNGDIVFEPDVDALIAAHRSSGALATLVVRPHPSPFALGAVEVDAGGFVRRIAGAPETDASIHAAYVFTGVHLLSAEARGSLPERGCVVRQGYQPMIARGLPIAAVVDERPWADLGTISAYLDANLELARASTDPRGVVHASATIEGSVVDSVVGAHAIVGPNARLERCVVWDGTVVDAQLEDAVVTPKVVVRRPR